MTNPINPETPEDQETRAALEQEAQAATTDFRTATAQNDESLGVKLGAYAAHVTKNAVKSAALGIGQMVPIVGDLPVRGYMLGSGALDVLAAYDLKDRSVLERAGLIAKGALRVGGGISLTPLAGQANFLAEMIPVRRSPNK
ncbi:MAG: hypothetical protein ACD_66C00050G0002 [uncultured bacterium]|uniref:Uncharacterized protein n=1 Tax=Candidatus Gottesmanbacteria bacterium GW2011_GWB1_43_11 TaxID=1618446 RepID=A0A0G1EUP8_9BACT|nr:MAG: hypothetical protein ACD_66C00050G0002 [uncultured bacterium]KKS41586.1 MAG: hypothetical protein UV04_C0006G0009 [Candidatus Gottesmanbacteria bacterium GW2011_GWA2_42_16]KKS55866.1 MAG: hypothetical protein UV17_C0006G0023 [Candidatus Gottesmanbacteria bacterium GW2011_GWA1_42_26]KKS81267.1 MAG: hypothetical protein UV55_C0017G0024 [Candidatus Gottesmanbacteria bacterium GW2011_GWC1_43_10]KKS86751.1 MAG: hypothetical protein UV61_C0007G0009 [Candidatus Gottesmanbacteria bacterium GW20